jgi:hypothetical protein
MGLKAGRSPPPPGRLRRAVGILQADLKVGPEASVNRLVKGESNAHTPTDFAATAAVPFPKVCPLKRLKGVGEFAPPTFRRVPQ